MSEVNQARANAARRAAQARMGDPASQTIATTPDGGRVYKRADGQLGFTSPNYATNDQDAIQRILEGDSVKRVVQSTTDKMTIAQNPIAARAQEFNQGVPLVGEWLDEGVELFSPDAASAMRQTSDAMERERPGESTALNIAGGIAGTLPLVAGAPIKAAANFVGAGRGLISKGLRAGVVAAPAAATEGAAAFSGRADEGRRLAEGGKGAAIGGAMAVAGGPIFAALGAGATKMMAYAKKMDVDAIARQLGVSKPAARVIKGHLVNDDLDAAARALAQGGPNAMLADAGTATRSALDSAMQTGGSALSVGRRRVNERATQAGQTLVTALDDILGQPEGIKSATKAIAQRTAKARRAAYQRAYSQPTPMTGKAGATIEGVLNRVSPKHMRSAIDAANDMLRDAVDDQGNQLFPNLNIMARIADDGTVTFSQPLSVPQLDYLARGLYEVAEAGTDRMTGAMSAEAARAANQAKALRDAMKGSVDGYATALKLGGDAIAEREALSMGRKVLSQSMTVEDVRAAMRGASEQSRAAARQGMRQAIDDVMSRARTTLGNIENGTFTFDGNGDAIREALAAVQQLSTRKNMTKARLILGRDADRLFKELQEAGAALALRGAVAQNSATAIRTAGREAMAAEAQPGLVRRTAGEAGNPLDAARELTRAAAGTDEATSVRMTQQTAAEVADALTRLRGPEAAQAIDAMRLVIAGQPIKDADAAAFGRAIAAILGGSAYQTGLQSLKNR